MTARSLAFSVRMPGYRGDEGERTKREDLEETCITFHDAAEEQRHLKQISMQLLRLIRMRSSSIYLAVLRAGESAMSYAPETARTPSVAFVVGVFPSHSESPNYFMQHHFPPSVCAAHSW